MTFHLGNFKPWLKSSIFKYISWLNGSLFGDADRGFLKEGVKIYLLAPLSPLNSPTLFSVFISIVYCFTLEYGEQDQKVPIQYIHLHYVFLKVLLFIHVKSTVGSDYHLEFTARVPVTISNSKSNWP
jgi:hypothetical protein